MDIGFDVISDLYLEPDDSFNWEGKATSLYCLVAGNVSSNLRTIVQTLAHLSKLYQGVFYIPGTLEYQDSADIKTRTEEILQVCSRISNLAVLHHHVIIIDGIAVLGANGWYDAPDKEDLAYNATLEIARYEDVAYLKKSIQKLQKHLDVKKILLLTSSVPNDKLYFGEVPDSTTHSIPLSIALGADTESKITHWAFGTYKKIVDTSFDGINYVCNPRKDKSPYWAKRISVAT